MRGRWVFIAALVLLLAHAETSYSRKLGRPEEVESKEPWMEQISWKPRAFYFHNFVTDEEADHIKQEAMPFMKRSTVVGSSGESVLDNIRTSYGTFLPRLHTKTIASVEDRVAKWTHLNVSHQEDFQILRYGIGQKYGAHYDTLEEDHPRYATVIIYLHDTQAGGESAFTSRSEWIDAAAPKRLGPFSACAEGHVAARPKKGDALLFYDLLPNGRSQDRYSMHTACPVVRGTKWVAIKWIHTDPFRPELLSANAPPAPREALPDECLDLEGRCEEWAKAGECEANPHFMWDDPFGVGKCRRACGACEECAPGDLACQSRNRVRAGFLPLDDLRR